MNILGIETTCDETGSAVVEDGRKVLSNVVASSVDLQQKYGGVVPEVAAREQVRSIIPVIREALEKAAEVGGWKLEAGRGDVMWDNKSHLSPQNPVSHLSPLISHIDAVAVAHGPGLIGSLLIGVETAKTLALAWDKPLIPVNHLVGHIYANWMEQDHSTEIIDNRDDKTTNYELRTMNFPAVALIVSGGHTDLVLMTGHGKFKLLGSTLDDAAGEAFDKVAKLLGLGYPGGPEIERCAQQLTTDQGQLTMKFPRPMINSKDFDFSFSGLKTAVVNLVNQSYSSSEVTFSSHERDESRSNPDFRHSGLLRSVSNERNLSRIDSGVVPQSRTPQNDKGESDNFRVQIAAEFQQAVVDVLVKKTIRAAGKFGAKSIVVGGGVAANSELRRRMSDIGRKENIKVYFPSKNMSVDNGAMIAAAAFFNLKKVDPLKLSAEPSLHF